MRTDHATRTIALDLNDLADWALAQPPAAKAGYPTRICLCPVAERLKALGFYDVGVGYSGGDARHPFTGALYRLRIGASLGDAITLIDSQADTPRLTTPLDDLGYCTFASVTAACERARRYHEGGLRGAL